MNDVIDDINIIVYNSNNDKYFMIFIQDGKTLIVKDGPINIVSGDFEEKAIAIERNASNCNHDVVTILVVV